MKRLAFAFTGTAVVLFTGCYYGQQQLEVKQFEAPQKEVKIALNFPKKDPISGKTIEVGPYTLANEIPKEIYKYSKYHQYTIRYYGSRYPQEHTKGLKVDIKLNNSWSNGTYVVTYINQKAHPDWWTGVQFKIPYKITDKYVELKYPNNYTLRVSNDGLGNRIPFIDDPENLKKDMTNVLNKLSKAKLYTLEKITIKGEVNSKYKPEAVYGNFERMLNKCKDENNCYILNYKGNKYPLKVKVYPYRNGSKAVYTMTLNCFSLIFQIVSV